MASNKEILKQHAAKGQKYPYRSRFGTHANMVKGNTEDSTKVLCEDEYGEYVTERTRIDDGTADPNRTAESRLKTLLEGGKS